MRHSCVPFKEQHHKRIEFCNDPVDVSDKGLQRRRAYDRLQLPEPSAGTVRLSYEGTGSLFQTITGSLGVLFPSFIRGWHPVGARTRSPLLPIVRIKKRHINFHDFLSGCLSL